MTVTNRAWDPTAVGFVSWRTGTPDPTGIAYPGPDAFGNTSDYAVVGGGLEQSPVEAQLHDLTHNPVGLWQLDGSLVDLSPTGDDLSVSTGAELYGPGAAPGTQAAYFNGVTRIQSTGGSPGPAALRILGDVTLELLVFPMQLTNDTFGSILATCSGTDASGTAANNFLYSLRLHNNLNNPGLYWENGSGVLNLLIDTDLVLAPGRWHHLAMVRISGGAGATTGKILLNGVKVAETTTFNEPDGGSSAFIKLGDFDDGTGGFTGYMQSVKVIPAALTDAQVLAEARLTLPPSVRP